MRRRYSVALVSTVMIISWGYWVNQKPSFECKVNQDVASYTLEDANTLNNLSNNILGTEIYGDYNSNSDKYQKSSKELFLISEAYRLKASKLILDNQSCFSEIQIREAKKVINFQKYLSDLE
jgi:hypothetical protein